ncbi:hypothetical protein [Streptomyces sp. NPDC007088]|uniref:hypothetical protein n=1 Tax=Streptomyces sp. NPDC007088 TaxID=3364773 RepID=UPI00368ED6C7
MNTGAVLRRGALVERPAPSTARALHAHLRALREHGFDAAPTPLRLTGDGREQLTYIPGDVALPPFPRWAMTETALRSVGELLRRLHEASAGVPVDSGTEWPRALADPEGGTMLCHNDVCWDRVQEWLAAHHRTFAKALLDDSPRGRRGAGPAVAVAVTAEAAPVRRRDSQVRRRRFRPRARTDPARERSGHSGHSGTGAGAGTGPAVGEEDAAGGALRRAERPVRIDSETARPR